MSEYPSPSLVSHIRHLILEIFEVSEDDAQHHASGLAGLAEGWGDPGTATGLDWAYRIKKNLGEKLRWRSETAHAQFLNDRQRTVTAYDEYVRRGKHA
ncbi:MAG: hypothetical protein WCD79_22505 [Chthoniobacteraceae bacterium]